MTDAITQATNLITQPGIEGFIPRGKRGQS